MKAAKRMLKRDTVDQFPENRHNLIPRSNQLAAFISGFDPSDLPKTAVIRAKYLIADTVAAAFAGVQHKASRINRDVVALLGGNPQASVIGEGRKTSMPFAGQVNAKMANILDLDDCYMNVAHFAPQAVFGALSAGECLNIPGRRLIASVALGYDVGARICLSFMFWRVRRGLITTLGSRQVYGANAFAAMAASAHALGLTRAQTEDAFGNCGHFAPCLTRSIMTVYPPDEMNKYCDAGWSTNVGIMASLLAREGYLSTHFTLDGRDGYAAVMGIDTPDNERLTDRLGETWHILDAALKTHPCCKYVHTPLQVFSELLHKHRIKPDGIQKVDVYVRPSHAVGFAVQRLPEQSAMPFTHNIPFNLAQAAYGRTPNAEWHDGRYLKDPRVKRLMRRIFTHPLGEALTVGVEDVYRYGYPREIPSRVEITARNSVFVGEARRTKGDPWWKDTRFSEKDLFNKLVLGCQDGLGRADINRLFDTIMDLERAKDISAIGDSFRKYAVRDRA